MSVWISIGENRDKIRFLPDFVPDGTLITRKHLSTQGTIFHVIEESYPPTFHCAYLLLLLSGFSFQPILYMGMNIHR